MANPMDRIGYADIDLLTVTFEYDNTIIYDDEEDGGSAQIGLAVTLTADDTAGLAGDGDAILGQLVVVSDDGYCTVAIGGFVDLPAGNGAALTLMKKIVGAVNASSAKGYIREMNTGTAAENGKSRGFIVNNDDTAHVWVYLN